jgi:hypothetical protein
VFDGFDTNSEARDFGDSLIHSVLQETKRKLTKRVGKQGNDGKFSLHSEALVCVLSSFEDNPCIDKSRTQSPLSISGGLSAIVDFGLNILDDPMPLENDSYHLLLTTSETSREIIGIDGKQH